MYCDSQFDSYLAMKPYVSTKKASAHKNGRRNDCSLSWDISKSLLWNLVSVLSFQSVPVTKFDEDLKPMSASLNRYQVCRFADVLIEIIYLYKFKSFIAEFGFHPAKLPYSRTFLLYAIIFIFSESRISLSYQYFVGKTIGRKDVNAVNAVSKH